MSLGFFTCSKMKENYIQTNKIYIQKEKASNPVVLVRGQKDLELSSNINVAFTD